MCVPACYVNYDIYLDSSLLCERIIMLFKGKCVTERALVLIVRASWLRETLLSVKHFFWRNLKKRGSSLRFFSVSVTLFETGVVISRQE
jgi:hypothetical protein